MLIAQHRLGKQCPWMDSMGNFDDVLIRIQAQIDSIKKSLRVKKGGDNTTEETKNTRQKFHFETPQERAMGRKKLQQS